MNIRWRSKLGYYSDDKKKVIIDITNNKIYINGKCIFKRLKDDNFYYIYNSNIKQQRIMIRWLNEHQFDFHVKCIYYNFTNRISIEMKNGRSYCLDNPKELIQDLKYLLSPMQKGLFHNVANERWLDQHAEDMDSSYKYDKYDRKYLKHILKQLKRVYKPKKSHVPKWF